MHAPRATELMTDAWRRPAGCATIPRVTGGPNLRTLPAPSDAELVRRARGGDGWAREALYRRHVGALGGLLIRLLGSRADAEDALQDTFLVAFAELARLREPEALAGWLVRIAVRQAHRRFRRRRLRRLLGLDRGEGEGLEELAAPGLSAEARAELGLLDRALAALPAGPRIAWMMRYVEGHELTAVAAACGCSLATVKRRIAAAQARLGDRGVAGGER